LRHELDAIEILVQDLPFDLDDHLFPRPTGVLTARGRGGIGMARALIAVMCAPMQ
jgi:hypothetical protein